MNIRTWRDQPKPGETDARWCASLAIDGHIQHITHGHDSEDAARQACAARAALAITVHGISAFTFQIETTDPEIARNMRDWQHSAT